jgi:N-acylglucosamine 2-epimerase
MQNYSILYRDELLQKTIPFWQSHSIDARCGGYLTSLDRDGAVYDTDKWMWLQAREIWTFAVLYREVEQRPEWFTMAKHGMEFLRRFGRDPEGAFYFGLTREGKPLVQGYNIYADFFAAMAFSAMDAIQPGSGYREETEKTFESILKRRDNPKGQYNKAVPGTRPLKSHSFPMMLSILSMEIEPILGKDYVEEVLRKTVDEIFTDFYKEEHGAVLENVAPDGGFVDSFEGRLISPGHTVESMWFLMDAGERLGDNGVIRKAADITLEALERGWDKDFRGLFYFLDVKGKYPPLQLEWDQKLWWVHLEGLIACAKGYLHTKDERLLRWFEKLHGYTWEHFRDPWYGEWFGYLNRRGGVLLPIKGGKWKGCFHVPRAQLQLWKTLEKFSG